MPRRHMVRVMLRLCTLRSQRVSFSCHRAGRCFTSSLSRVIPPESPLLVESSQSAWKDIGIPEIPPGLPYSREPTPWMSAPELQTYLQPLLAVGWRVEWSSKAAAFELVVDFPVSRFTKAVELVNSIATISEVENHHPNCINWTERRVHIAVCTHNALCPASKSNPSEKRLPGLTLRDVRFATLLQNKQAEEYTAPKGRKGQSVTPTDVIGRSLAKDIMTSAGIPFKD